MSVKKIFESLRKLNEGWDQADLEDEEYIINLAPEGFREHLKKNLNIGGLNSEEMGVLPYGDSDSHLEIWSDSDEELNGVSAYDFEGEPWADFVIKWTNKLYHGPDGPWNHWPSSELEIEGSDDDHWLYCYYLPEHPELKYKPMSFEEFKDYAIKHDDISEEDFEDEVVVQSVKEWLDRFNGSLSGLNQIKVLFEQMYQEYLALPEEDRAKLDKLTCHTED